MYSAQYKKLLQAYVLNSSIALKSASWGKFQIMGENYSKAGYTIVEDFVNFIQSNTIIYSYIIIRDWLQFARAYNGSAQVGYDTKMKNNYVTFKNE